MTLPEHIGRINAMAYDRCHANKDAPEYEGVVYLSGKRTIIHPCMTQYIIPHEYGHLLEYYITCKKRIDSPEKYAPDNIYWKEYADMRGIPMNTTYGGGNWKDNIQEIIADDFRIIMTDTDIDFYVHSCTHPKESDVVQDYWKELFKQYAI